MIEFICSGSEEHRRNSIFKKAGQCVSEGRKAYLLVPDQQVLAYEDEAGKKLPPSAPLSFTVTSFSLLSDIASRKYGALSYKMLTRPQKVLFMWKAIKEVSPFLSVYGRSSPEALSVRMLECVDELKSCGVTCEHLLDASACMTDSPVFSKKLSDIASVYSAYSALTQNKYSDVNDEQKKLLGFLEKEDMFSGYDVYIDSFTDFTRLQLEIIAHIFHKAENVCVSLHADPSEDVSIQFECIRQTFFDLAKLCERYGKEYTVTSQKMEAGGNFALEYLSENLLSPRQSVYEGKYAEGERIEAFACLDVQEEICACINLIKRALYEGYKLSDIAVLSRDPSKYEKLLALSAADAKIPLFTSDKMLISDSCFAVYMISLLKIISGGWRRSDILAHLKCGLTDFSFEDISRFDLYTSRWDIDGRARFCGKDFSASYKRFSDKGDEDDEFIISSNKIKNGLFPRILSLEEKLTKAKTVNDMLISLFEYTEENNTAQKLSDTSNASANTGDLRTAEQNARTYNTAVRLLDDIAYALDGEPAMSVRDLCSMIELIFSNTEIGFIPTRKDEVILADASLYRSFGHKVVIILGMKEGDFPRAISGAGLITDAEKSLLRNEGIDLTPSAVISASKEYLHLWKAITTAKEQLYVTYPQRCAGEGECAPGIAIKSISALLGKEHVRIFSECMGELMYDPLTTFSGLSSQESGSVYKKLADEYCRDTDSESIRLGGKNASLTSAHSLSEESASRLVPTPITVSPTSLEAYNKCAFSYFCSRFLELDDGRKNEYSAIISGSLIHEILEKYLAKGKKYTAEETEEICRKISDEYYDETCPEHLSDNERLKLNFTRAAINAALLARFAALDIENSGFSPTAFEKQIHTPLCDDTNGDVYLRGRIDRVDMASTSEGDFLRIIDYKSGSKKFSLEETQEGTELQLPLYLSALMKGDNSVMPGGFLYLSSAVSRHDVSSAAELEDTEALDASIVSKIEASGILNSLFTQKKSAKLQGLSDERIREILMEAESVATDTVKRMRKGNISPSPKKISDRYTCEYCPYFAVCRSKKQG